MIFDKVVHNFGKSLFSKKMLISDRCISGLMPNLIKKSWTVSITHCLAVDSKDGFLWLAIEGIGEIAATQASTKTGGPKIYLTF